MVETGRGEFAGTRQLRLPRPAERSLDLEPGRAVGGQERHDAVIAVCSTAEDALQMHAAPRLSHAEVDSYRWPSSSGYQPWKCHCEQSAQVEDVSEQKRAPKGPSSEHKTRQQNPRGPNSKQNKSEIP